MNDRANLPADEPQPAGSTRRELLAATGAAAAWALGTATLPRGAAAVEPVEPGYVDAHVHVWTPETTRYPLAAGFRHEEMRPASFTPEQLWKHARPCGVGRVVLIQMSFYGFDNSYMLDCIAAEPGRFAGVAVIDDEGAEIEATMRSLGERGVRGFRIYPRNRPAASWLDGEGMRRMWVEGARAGQAMCCLINPDALPALDRMCNRHPETPVVIDHFARIGIDGQFREEDIRALTRLARYPKTYVKLSAFYALGKRTPPYDDLLPLIGTLLEAYGPDRLMWATDCPYQVDAQTYEASLAVLRDRADFLSADDRAWVLGKTAERVFFAT